MNDFGTTIALLIASLFAVVSIVHLFGPKSLRAVYREAGYSRSFLYVVTTTTGLVAAFLAVNQLRIWGGILAAMLLFVLCAKLLFRERYLYAVPAIIVLFALGPAMA